jgi:hypothetical protein
VTTRPKVYIAGPITQGDTLANIGRAVQIADRLMGAGFTPYCPHLNALWHMFFPHEHKEWIDLDMHWLGCCDVLYRIEGASVGADDEVERAKTLGMPVFTSLYDIITWNQEREARCQP